MALSVEAIIALVTLLVTCLPAFFIIWKMYRRHFSSRMRAAYEPEVLSAFNRPSSRGHLIHHIFTERRMETRFMRSDGQPYTTPAFVMGDYV